MSDSNTPADIHPCLTYADANAAMDWLCRAFRFTKRLVVPGPDGTVRHSEHSLGTGGKHGNREGHFVCRHFTFETTWIGSGWQELAADL